MTLDELMACCASKPWAEAMFASQPFSSADAMHAAADDIWWRLTQNDWKEAFSKHPKIGERSNAKWSADEQVGMSHAAAAVAEEMAQLNADYQAKFGFIYIVCASGKSAVEMLEILRKRMGHSREEEMRIAADEHSKITHLRLNKLLAK